MATASISESAVSLNTNPNAPTGPVLHLVKGRPVVSSLQVAEHFGKQHYNVLRSIEAILRNAPESFGALNFEGTSVKVAMPNGGGFKDSPAYDLTRDGFVVVAMGFTGKKAIAWKIAYVQAFNAMEAELMRQQEPTGTITATQQQELKELVQAKASAYPDAVKRKVFSQIWIRLQRKFKVPRYEELPVAVFGEARDYVIAMQVRSVDAPALEGVEPKDLPSPAPLSTIHDYASIFGALPGMSHWRDLSRRLLHAHDAFQRELDAIKKDAIRPFCENRRIEVSTFLDSATTAVYRNLFDIAEDGAHTAYRGAYGALLGLEGLHDLLVRG